MASEWPTLALFWFAQPASPAKALADPIFGKPLKASFSSTLPAWNLIAGWLLTIAVIRVPPWPLSSFLLSAADRVCSESAV